MIPDISVIIAAYNVEPYIRRAIDSALNQDSVTVEVIVIDDCSSDETLSIMSATEDSRVQCIKMNENSGPGAARNAGFKLARGKWIAVLDGDDEFAAGRLARCMKCAEANNADIVVDNITVRFENNEPNTPMFAPEQWTKLNHLDLATFINGKLSNANSYTLGYLKPIFTAEFLRAHNLLYAGDIRIGEDYLLMAQALASGAICAAQKSEGYFYTARSGSISHRLTSHDVAMMREGDARLLSAYTLDASALKEQQQRSFQLKELYAYNLLVEAIKAKNITAAIAAIKQCPSAVRHLWQPIWARIKI